MGIELDYGNARIVVKKGDITREETDAIVNAANSTLLGGGGVDGAIHRAGGPEILEECRRIVERVGRCPTGEAVITTAGKLPARFVIHTVGPVWSGKPGQADQLAAAYRNSIRLASEQGLASIAFPSISTGAYRYPIADASRIAIRTVLESIEGTSLRDVRFILFSDDDTAVYERALPEVAEELRGR
jgi:O-acetyl-ADP-ribose deacetylase (regulator of RNase III)